MFERHFLENNFSYNTFCKKILSNDFSYRQKSLHQTSRVYEINQKCKNNFKKFDFVFKFYTGFLKPDLIDSKLDIKKNFVGSSTSKKCFKEF